MNTQHTPGRLTVRGGYSIYADDGNPVADTCLANSVPANDESNARRLVACWNACEMVSTEDLEALTRPGDVSWACTIDRVVRERDELLTALGDCLDAMPDTTANINEAIAFPTSAPAYVRESVSLLTAQRDELLAALKAIAAGASNMRFDAYIFARSAIAKAEGGATSQPAQPVVQHLPADDTEGGAL